MPRLPSKRGGTRDFAIANAARICNSFAECTPYSVVIGTSED